MIAWTIFMIIWSIDIAILHLRQRYFGHQDSDLLVLTALYRSLKWMYNLCCFYYEYAKTNTLGAHLKSTWGNFKMILSGISFRQTKSKPKARYTLKKVAQPIDEGTGVGDIGVCDNEIEKDSVVENSSPAPSLSDIIVEPVDNPMSQDTDIAKQQIMDQVDIVVETPIVVQTDPLNQGEPLEQSKDQPLDQPQIPSEITN